ncbi:hypothetical protein BDA96_03G221900 [Sorghum bicolor]|uniref:Pectinesterase inhibitor domain-containing protein n=1 Tax=Sorghum bicolor TaxID=4558 RepID=A0A921RFB6_SORBI|nr:hypothetical protein BDA96_03G221900 [Sorghum bicolor]
MAARLVSVSVSVPLLLLVVVLAGSRAALASETRKEHLASFCVSSLQAALGSEGADARGLAAIATNLTLANYTAAVASIKALERRGGWPERSRRALATSRAAGGTIEALNVVHSAVHALATGKLRGYVFDMEVVRKAASDCEDAFGGAGGNCKLPLRKVDDDADNLTVAAMLIVRSLGN